MIGDISPLVGRRFVAGSYNVCIMRWIGEGAVRAAWAHDPSQADMDEMEAWAASILGEIEITRSVGNEAEAANLQRWREQRANEDEVTSGDVSSGA